MKNEYVFILSPSYSGSTVLWKMIGTAENVSIMPEEGQFLPEAEPLMRNQPWNENTPPFNWKIIKNIWHTYWDNSKKYLLEKTPENLMRVHEIQNFFKPIKYIILVRNPYALVEGIMRRNDSPPKGAAWFVIKILKKLKMHAETLDNSLVLSYEDFVNDTKNIAERIEDFLPDIGKIDFSSSYKSHSIDGVAERPIIDFNKKKLEQLSDEKLVTINNVFLQYKELLDYWGYQLYFPSWYNHDTKSNSDEITKPILYLHIGSMGTNPEYLQEILFTKKDELLRNGLYIPFTGTEPQEKSITAEYLFKAIVKKIHPNANLDINIEINDIFISLFKEINDKAKNSNVLISSEKISLLSPKGIDFLVDLFKDKFNIKVICYVSRQDELLEQRIIDRILKTDMKTRNYSLKELKEYVQKNMSNELQFLEYLNYWASLIGQGNITVKPFDKKKLYMNDVLLDFLKEIKLPNDISTESQAIRERIIDRDILEFKIKLNNSNLPLAEVNSVSKLLEYEGDKNIAKYSILNLEERLKIINFYSENNSKTAEKFLDKKYGSLFDSNLDNIEYLTYQGLTEEKNNEIRDFLDE